MIKKTPVVVFIAVLLGASISLSSRDSRTQETLKSQTPLQYEVSVVLKLIQVYVTDKNGKPVLDLKKDEFLVFDNGQPVTITEFEKHGLLPSPLEIPKPAAESVSATPTLPPRSLNRKFFVFFDFAYNNQKGVVKVIKAALNFLDTQVRAGDEAALLSYSMLKGFTIYEYLTPTTRKSGKRWRLSLQKQWSAAQTKLRMNIGSKPENPLPLFLRGRNRRVRPRTISSG